MTSGEYDEVIIEKPEGENSCYEAVCDDCEWTIRKRGNASEWENQTMGCLIYDCDNVSGPIVRTNCDPGFVCSSGSGKCIDETSLVRVEIEVGIDEIVISQMNTTDIAETISMSCDIPLSDIEVGWIIDEDGIIRIVIIMEEEESAETIANMIQTCIRSEPTTTTSLSTD